MNLFLLRHAIAVPHGYPGIDRDGDRPLTPKGEKKMRRIAEGLLALDLTFDLILSSPLVRARQTAEILAKVFDGEKKVKYSDHLAVGGDARMLINDVNERFGVVDNVVLVGHEPSLSELISVLLSGSPGLPFTMKKGGVCNLAIDKLIYGRCATLEWLLTPAQLSRIN